MPRSLTRSRSRVAGTGALLAGVVLLTACSSSQDGTATASRTTSGSASTSAAPSPTPTAPSSTSAAPSSTAAPKSAATPSSSAVQAPGKLAGLALTGPDFPPPFVYQPVNPADVAKAAAGALGAGATYDPPTCATSASSTSGADLANAGVAAALDKTNGVILVETVTTGGKPISTLSDVARKCASFTVTSPQTGPAKATVALLDKPKVDADASAAVKVTTTVSPAGQPRSIEVVSYIAEVGGVQVTVAATSISGSAVDLALLGELLSKGVSKVKAG